MRRVTSFALVLGFAACASQQKPIVTASCAMPAAAAAPAPAPATAQPPPEVVAISAGDLTGTWVEFWTVAGHADTQRYTFFEDGRFSWRAAVPSEENFAPRAGHWKLEKKGESVTALLLTLDARHADECAQGSPCAATPPHEAAVEERLPLGECPPDDDAKALDAAYRCLSIGGHAYWRRSPAE